MAFKQWSKKTVFPNREALQFKDFRWSFKSLIKSLKDRLLDEKDAFCLITGKTGSGKSHLAGTFCLKMRILLLIQRNLQLR